MKDYIISTGHAKDNSILLNCPTDLVKYNLSHYSLPHQLYACDVSSQTSLHEPFTYNQDVSDERWVDTINKELNALETNNTWMIVPKPSNKKVNGFK